MIMGCIEVSVLTVFNMTRMDKNHILKILSYAKVNKMEAVWLMIIGVTTLYCKIGKYHLG